MLWRRYLRDGAMLLRLFLTRVIPGALYQRLRAPCQAALANAWVSSCLDNARRRCIRPHGAWCGANLTPMRRSFERAARQRIDVDIDLSDVPYVDSAFIGLLMLLYGHQSQCRLGFVVRGASPVLRRIFKCHCAEYLLQTDGAGSGAEEEAAQWREPMAAIS